MLRTTACFIIFYIYSVNSLLKTVADASISVCFAHARMPTFKRTTFDTRLLKCWGNYCQKFQIRHYCNTSTMLTMAVPSQVNPILAVNLPLVLATPPPLAGLSIMDPNAGGSPATEALRLSLLGVGAIHQAYLLARSTSVDMSLVKTGTGGAADELMNLAISYRLQATKCLALACQTIEGTRSDAALGASVTIALIDVSPQFHRLDPLY